jgi:hypothetical protein
LEPKSRCSGLFLSDLEWTRSSTRMDSFKHSNGLVQALEWRVVLDANEDLE